MNDRSFTQEMYVEHHRRNREIGFSILKDDRGEFFKKSIGVGKRVLDIGCRDGALTSFFVSGNTVVGVDIDPVALERAQKEWGIQTMTFDLHGDWMTLHNEKFDAIVAGEVLEHLFYPEKIVTHVAAHLAPEGVFVGSVPNAFSLKNRIRYLFAQKKNTPLADPTHINHFSVAEMHSMLSRHFHTVTVSGLGRYRWLAKQFPSFCAFDIVFVAKGPR